MINITVEKNKSYINTPNIFSKLMLLKNHIKNEKAILIITENEKSLQDFLKISKYLKQQKIINKNLYKLDNISNFVDIVYNKRWFYISTTDIFNLKPNILNNPKNILELKKDQNIPINDVIQKLMWLKYSFKEYENPWSFKATWDVLSFTDTNNNTYKISFWWDTIDNILDTKNNQNLDNLFIWKNEKIDIFELNENFCLETKNSFNNRNIFIILDSIDFSSLYQNIIDNLKNFINFPCLSKDSSSEIDIWLKDLFIENIDDLKTVLWKNKYKYIFTKNTKTFKNFVDFNSIHWVHIFKSDVNNLKSFEITSSPNLSPQSPHPNPLPRGEGEEQKGNQKNQNFKNTVFICDDNISRIFIKKRRKRSISKEMDLLLQIKPWNYIVHIDHWIWIFTQIISKELPCINNEKIKNKSIKKEYIEVEYKNNDKLFVPITEIWRVSKYVWSENPKLTPLSTKKWENKLKRANKEVEKIAKELLEIYARRKLNKWFKFLNFKKEEWIFQKSFEYTYTKDQIHIIAEIFQDMESEIPTDRLLCWDVWFWKTEIAFNAIYKTIINRKQAVLISPLVILAYEHFEKAKERFQDLKFNIELITRLQTPNQVKTILEKLKDWKIDLIIWTHRLLSDDIKFKNLWFLVIDEEHKFWVTNKEKIKKFKWNIDILSMSATPIPRSLNMALNWIKNISMLKTPPPGRQDITTIVSEFSDSVIFQAWEKEFKRGGQLFFIHNRVETISNLQFHLEKLFPKRKIIITHGQLPWNALEKRIIDFKNKKYDILLSTTVIENGIDFTNVNTIFINEAWNFWISQIHQLRWRVWRSDRKSYCYLLFKKDKIKQDAIKRLKTIVNYSHLWAWFELAIKDLEMRGWWDILGIKQSGQSIDIGVNLFLQMLENKIEELKNNVDVSGSLKKSWLKVSTKIDLNINVFIDDNFFSWDLDKINFYRDIESISTIEDLENTINDFKEINETIPVWTSNFFNLLRLKILSSQYYLSSIKRVWINYQIDFEDVWDEKQLVVLKKFLDLDRDVKFKVISMTRIRSEVKNFKDDLWFLEYMLKILG